MCVDPVQRVEVLDLLIEMTITELAVGHQAIYVS
jgi:hypothetical protein